MLPLLLRLPALVLCCSSTPHGAAMFAMVSVLNVSRCSNGKA